MENDYKKYLEDMLNVLQMKLDNVSSEHEGEDILNEINDIKKELNEG
jgi:hypothetical protein